MKIERRNPQHLTATEIDQETARVEAIAAAYGPNQEDVDWSEQPCIIITEDGKILDGHHRHAAFAALGYTTCRVLVVGDDFRERVGEVGLQAATREAADEVGCAYTWAAA